MTLTPDQEKILLLADEMNQFGMAVETFAYDTGAPHRLLPREDDHEAARKLLQAARRMREKIAPIIQEFDTPDEDEVQVDAIYICPRCGGRVDTLAMRCTAPLCNWNPVAHA